jgi:predicted flap endonuclease-1-like 5' DNA nuclease
MSAVDGLDQILDRASRLDEGGTEASSAPFRSVPRERVEATPQTRARMMSLHVSKLRGITYELRGKLKQRGITYSDQLLEAAGGAEKRRGLAAATGIEEAVLSRLVCRADLARIKGIGAIFADMLELIGIDRVARLATQDATALHATLHELNLAERFARRAPTPEEVISWIAQAKALPPRVGED